MRICIPVAENRGLESVPYNHFGSAPNFLIYDTLKKESKAINNQNLHHEHGQCQPLKALNGEAVDAILVGGIGAGALNKLNALGVRVYQVADVSLEKNIELLEQGQLPEFTVQHTCKGHDCGGHH